MKPTPKHHLIIIRLMVILIFTINDHGFEFRPYIDHMLTNHYMIRIVTLFILCLTFMASAENTITIWEVVDALAATIFFLVLIDPVNLMSHKVEDKNGNN